MMSQEDQVIMGITKRGARKPIHNGYQYIVDRTNETYTNYRCCEKKLKCPARIKIYNCSPYMIKQLPTKGHNHLPRIEEQIEAEQSRCKRSLNKLSNSEGLAARLVNPRQGQGPFHSFLVEEEPDHQQKIEGLATQLVNTSEGIYQNNQVDVTSNSAGHCEGWGPKSVLANEISSRHELPQKQSSKGCLKNRKLEENNSSEEINTINSNVTHSHLEKGPKNYMESFQIFCQKKELLAKKVRKKCSFTNLQNDVSNKVIEILSTKKKIRPRSIITYTEKSSNIERISINKEKEHKDLFSDNIKSYTSPPNSEDYDQPFVKQIIHRKKILESELKNNSTFEEYLISTVRGEPQYLERCDLNNKEASISSVGSNEKLSKIDKNLENNKLKIGCVNTINKQGKDLQNVINDNIPFLSVKEKYMATSEIKHNTMEPPTKKRKLPPLRSIYDKTNEKKINDNAVQPKINEENTQKKNKIIEDKVLQLINFENSITKNHKIIENNEFQLTNAEPYINKSEKTFESNTLSLKNTKEYPESSDKKLYKNEPIVLLKKLKIAPGQVVNIKDIDCTNGIEDIIIKMEPIDSSDFNETATESLKNLDQDLDIKLEEINIKKDVIKEENEHFYDVDGVSLEIINTKKNICQNIMKTLHKIANVSSQIENYITIDSTKDVVDVDSDILEFDSENLDLIEDVILREVQKVRKLIAQQAKISHQAKENILKSQEKLCCGMSMMKNQIEMLKTNNESDKQESILRNLLCTANDNTTDKHISDIKIHNIYSEKGPPVLTDKKKLPPFRSVYKTKDMNSIADKNSNKLPALVTNIEQNQKSRGQTLIQQIDYKRHPSQTKNNSLPNDTEKYPKFVKNSRSTSLKSNKKLHGRRSLNRRRSNKEKGSLEIKDLTVVYQKQYKETKKDDSNGLDNNHNTDISIVKNNLPKYGGYYNNAPLPPNEIYNSYIEYLKQHKETKINDSTKLDNNYNTDILISEINLTKTNEYCNNVPMQPNTKLNINKSSVKYSQQHKEFKIKDSTNLENNHNTDILNNKSNLTECNRYYISVPSQSNQVKEFRKSPDESFKHCEEYKRNDSASLKYNHETDDLISKKKIIEHNEHYNNISLIRNLVIDKNCFVSDKPIDFCPVCKAELDFTLYLDLQIMTALCICNLNIVVLLDPEPIESSFENEEQNNTSSSLLSSHTNSNCHMYKRGDELQLSKSGYSDIQCITLRNLLCSDKKTTNNHGVDGKKSESESKTIVKKDAFSKPLKKRKMPPLYSIYATPNKTPNRVQILNKLSFRNSNQEEVLKVQHHNQKLEDLHLNNAGQIPLACTTKDIQPNVGKDLYSNSSSSDWNSSSINNSSIRNSSSNIISNNSSSSSCVSSGISSNSSNSRSNSSSYSSNSSCSSNSRSTSSSTSISTSISSSSSSSSIISHQETSQSSVKCLSSTKRKAIQIAKENHELYINKLSEEFSKKLEISDLNEKGFSVITLNNVEHKTPSSKEENIPGSIMNTVHRSNSVQTTVNVDNIIADNSNKNILRSEEYCHLQVIKRKRKPKQEGVETDFTTWSDELKNYIFQKLESVIKWRSIQYRGPTIWEFLVRLLLRSETNPLIVRWENKENYVLRFIKPNCIASLWNSRGKCIKKVPYTNFARGIRYWYSRGGLEVVQEKQLVYKLGPKAIAYMNKLLETKEPS